MPIPVVLGIDSSTQSTKVLAVHTDTGDLIATARASHTGEDTQHPDDWWAALHAAVHDILATHPDLDAQGLAVSGQQHGCVLIDASGRPVRPAPLWNNTASALDAEHLNGLADFAAETGSRLVASYTITKLAHITRTAPHDLARTTAIGLPHDWLNLRLTGTLTTDRGDASGTGWWSPRDNAYRRDLLALAIGADHAARLQLPEVRDPDEPAGTLSDTAAADLGLPAGIPVGPGSGDNMAAALGIGARTGEVIISLGTSGTAFAVSESPTADPTGEVAGFADATGRFLPLACMLNCTRVVDSVARLVGLDRDDALLQAGALPPGAGGLLMLPYLGGERTPNLPQATGSLDGLTDANATPALLVRAALDGVAAGLAYCVDALAALGITAPAITIVGGGAIHPTWQQAVADATGLPVQVRAGVEHAARGAAAQAAAIARGLSVQEVAAHWQPEVIAEVPARPGLRDAFRLDDRRAMIEELVNASRRR